MFMNRKDNNSISPMGGLILLIMFLLILLPGCSSQQNSRITSMLPTSETKVAELEDTPIEIPTEIMTPPVVANVKSETIANQGVTPHASELTNPPSDSLPASGPNSDVFASSGKSSSPISVTIPQSSPIPALAKPSNLKNLPFTLSDIFFDYDQYTLHERDIKTLETNAQVLLGRYAKKKILIQGHCDERGTEEYNIVLGVRRAQAVKDYLVDLGVPSENVGVLSYGKEKPFCTQHSWNCWKHNRRSHFVFQ